MMDGRSLNLSGPRSMAVSIALTPISYWRRPFLASACAFSSGSVIRSGSRARLCLASFFASGFRKVFGGRRPQAFDLWIIACKQEKTDAELRVSQRSTSLDNEGLGHLAKNSRK